MQVCEVPRWQRLKAQLNNLKRSDFVRLYQQTPGAVLLDVRTPQEYENYHLEGATLVDYLSEAFLDQLDEMDKNTTYFVYCQSARRSIRTCTLLRNSGFEKVYNLEGGLNELPL